MTNDTASIDALRSAWRDAANVLVLTGAGISVASGLATYRGDEHSLYSDPRKLADAMAKSLRADPVAFWRGPMCERRLAFAAAKPNAAHRALVRMQLEKERFLLVTTNIDNLHRRAGSHDVVELHGNAFHLRPTDAAGLPDDTVPPIRDETDPELLDEMPMPCCPQSGRPLRNDIVLFGEAAPARWQPIADFFAAGPVDLVLLIGCSGVVAVPSRVIEMAHEAGHKPHVIEINPRPSDEPHLNDLLSARCPLPAEQALGALLG